jgi:membrane protein
MIKSFCRKWIMIFQQKKLSQPAKSGVVLMEFAYMLNDEVQKDRCLQRATSLTYTTLLAIFPMIAVMALFIPVFFGGAQEMETQIVGYVEGIILPDAGQEIEQSIHGYFEIFRKNSKAVGIFGILGLMISALLLFTNVEKSFNEIWGSRRRRSLVSLFSRFTTMLVFVPILIGASIFLTAEMRRHVAVMGHLFSLVVPYLITCMALTLAFYILPNTNVRFFNAFIGGVSAGLLWEMAKVAFGFYVANPKITLIYKSLGAIPIFLIWTYFTWLIVLVGCEFSFLLQNYKRIKMDTFRKDPHTVVDSKLVFLVFMVIADRYQKGLGGANFPLLMNKVLVTTEEMEQVISLLKNAGVILETEKELFIPSRPLETFRPAEILAIGCKVNTMFVKENELDEPTSRAVEEIQRFLVEWSVDKTLRDLFLKNLKTS